MAFVVNVGTGNRIKVDAVFQTLREYAPDVLAVRVPVQSGGSNQPLSREETYEGARNRAAAAFKNCDLSVGIESGLMSSPMTDSTWMCFCAVVIFDGKDIYVGQSAGFDLPPKVVKALDTCTELDDAVKKAGLTDVPNIGKVEGGLLGVLTKGRVSRKDYTKQAIQMAMVPFENRDLYGYEREA